MMHGEVNIQIDDGEIIDRQKMVRETGGDIDDGEINRQRDRRWIKKHGVTDDGQVNRQIDVQRNRWRDRRWIKKQMER